MVGDTTGRKVVMAEGVTGNAYGGSGDGREEELEMHTRMYINQPDIMPRRPALGVVTTNIARP